MNGGACAPSRRGPRASLATLLATVGGVQLEAVARRVHAGYRLRRPPACAPGSRCAPPDFVGIGAQRCGTTWWYELVTAHPEVHPGIAKELHYFHRYWGRAFTERDAARYVRYFPRPEGKLA